MKVSARSIAADVLVRVDVDKAYAAAALEAELDRTVQLSLRDRALGTELVYGTLRVLPWLDERLNRHAKRGVEKLHPRARALLEIAAYQIFFLTKVPAFAAVNECVEAIRELNGPHVAGFANAVLRKLARESAEATAPFDEEAIGVSVAPWLRSALEKSLGEEEAAGFLASLREVPPLAIRLNDAASRASWIEKFRAFAPEATFDEGALSPLAIVARGAGRAQSLPGYHEGQWSIQEEGSQVIALSLGAKEGDSVLDACAGRGNKSSLLAREVGTTGYLDAADINPAKLERLRTELGRIHVKPRETFAVDWTIGAGDVRGPYDCVLVDAPCSGTGTLRRRPELQIRRTANDVTELAALQLQILDATANMVRVDGTLVYAVCSVLREEGEDVVDSFLARRPDMALAPFEAAAAELSKHESMFRLLPHRHKTDGYFCARFRKIGGERGGAP